MQTVDECRQQINAVCTSVATAPGKSHSEEPCVCKRKRETEREAGRERGKEVINAKWLERGRENRERESEK